MQHFPACKELNFASRTDCDLQRRIELLSRSIMCAKSSTSRSSSAVEGEFLHELEEKMEVCVSFSRTGICPQQTCKANMFRTTAPWSTLSF